MSGRTDFYGDFPGMYLPGEYIPRCHLLRRAVSDIATTAGCLRFLSKDEHQKIGDAAAEQTRMLSGLRKSLLTKA